MTHRGPFQPLLFCDSVILCCRPWAEGHPPLCCLEKSKEREDRSRLVRTSSWEVKGCDQGEKAASGREVPAAGVPEQLPGSGHVGGRRLRLPWHLSHADRRHQMPSSAPIGFKAGGFVSRQ